MTRSLRTRLRGADDRFRLDLQAPARIDERGDDHHGRRRPNLAHYSNDRAARILGLGAGGVVPVAVDDELRLDPAGLADAHRRGAGVADDREDATAAVFRPKAPVAGFRVTPPGIDDLDALQLRIREELVHSGAFYVVKTRVRDRTYLRTTIINARTTEEDLSALLTAVRGAAGRRPAG